MAEIRATDIGIEHDPDRDNPVVMIRDEKGTLHPVTKKERVRHLFTSGHTNRWEDVIVLEPDREGCDSGVGVGGAMSDKIMIPVDQVHASDVLGRAGIRIADLQAQLDAANQRNKELSNMHSACLAEIETRGEACVRLSNRAEAAERKLADAQQALLGLIPSHRDPVNRCWCPQYVAVPHTPECLQARKALAQIEQPQQ